MSRGPAGHGEPAREVIERRVRIEIRETVSSVTPAQRDRIIEVVVGEIVDSAEQDGPA